MTLGLFPSRKHWIGSFYGRVLAELFSKLIYGILVTNYGLRLYVYHWDLPTTVRCLQQHHTVQLQSLLDIVVIDSPQSVSGRFGLLYTFWNYNRSLRFFVKTFTSGEVPIHSISQLFPSAGWLEREAWDLFGVQFLNHDDLRRILTDYGFRGHPLRKDFPLMGFLEIRYDDSQRCLVFEPVELTQEFRFFRFEMPWSLWPAN